MLTVALDSTAVTASAAIAEIENGAPKAYSLFTVRNKLTHSETLMPMLDSAIKSFGADIKDVGLFAVSAGPGSFTGVRIGVATIKGLAFGNNTPCVAVSTLEALARNIGNGFICPLMDARREQFYSAIFHGRSRMTSDRACGITELSEMLSGLSEITVCGDGAELFTSLYNGRCSIRIASEAVRDQNALSVALCGYDAFVEGRFVSPSALKPVYLRLPQAERERLEREKNLTEGSTNQ